MGGDESQGCWPRRWSLGSMVFALALSLVALASWVSPPGAQAEGNVYVTNASSANISQYAIGVTGSLSPLSPATVATGAFTFPAGAAVSADGRSAYVTIASGTVSQYDIDPVSGGLSPKTPATVAGGDGGRVAVTPDGRSAYVTIASGGLAVRHRSRGRRAVAQDPGDRRRGLGIL